MNQDFTAIALLIDRSGSMYSIRDATEEAINGFIQKQASEEGKRTVRLTEFDDQYHNVFTSCLARNAPRYQLDPRGSTSLYDAMARLITEFGNELREMPEWERPANVLVAIMTDGLENSSREQTARTVRGMVEHQQSVYGWNFLYMGANQDAILAAAHMGIKRNSSITYSASSAGVHNTAEVLESYTVAVAAGTAPSISEEDREKAMEDK